MASVTSSPASTYATGGGDSRWANPEDWAASKALEGVDARHANPDGSQGVGRSQHGGAGEKEFLVSPALIFKHLDERAVEELD